MSVKLEKIFFSVSFHQKQWLIVFEVNWFDVGYTLRCWYNGRISIIE